MSRELVSFEKCKVSKVGLTFNEEMTFEEWEGIGLQLQLMHGSVGFWIADWYLFGERKYGEAKAMAASLDMDYGTFRDYLWVARTIELSRRRDNVSFTSHKEIASAPKDKQDDLLDKADKENLSKTEVRGLVKDAQRQQKIDEFKKLSNGYNDKDIQIFNEKFQDYAKKIEDNSVDLILTDPPYPIEFLPLWQDMFEIAERILKPSAFLVTYANHQNLDEIFKLPNNLKYYWTFRLNFEAPAIRPIAMGRNLIATWKPVLIYQKLPFKKIEETIEDQVKEYTPFNYKERDMHTENWGQSIGKFEYLIDKFSKPNDLIFEPFAGTGTTLIAAQHMKRKCIGTEIEEKYIDLIKGRLNEQPERIH